MSWLQLHTHEWKQQKHDSDSFKMYSIEPRKVVQQLEMTHSHIDMFNNVFFGFIWFSVYIVFAPLMHSGCIGQCQLQTIEWRGVKLR